MGLFSKKKPAPKKSEAEIFSDLISGKSPQALEMQKKRKAQEEAWKRAQARADTTKETYQSHAASAGESEILTLAEKEKERRNLFATIGGQESGVGSKGQKIKKAKAKAKYLKN